MALWKSQQFRDLKQLSVSQVVENGIKEYRRIFVIDIYLYIYVIFGIQRKFLYLNCLFVNLS